MNMDLVHKTHLSSLNYANSYEYIYKISEYIIINIEKWIIICMYKYVCNV